MSAHNGPLVRRILLLTGATSREQDAARERAHDERAARERLYGGRRTIDAAPRTPPVKQDAPPVAKPQGARLDQKRLLGHADHIG